MTLDNRHWMKKEYPKKEKWKKSGKTINGLTIKQIKRRKLIIKILSSFGIGKK